MTFHVRKGKERRILASSEDMEKNVPIAWRFLGHSWRQASKQGEAPIERAVPARMRLHMLAYWEETTFLNVFVLTFTPRSSSVVPGSGQDVKCSLGYFPCGNTTKCLPQLLHCNGVDDCGNQADEDNCGE